MVGNSQNHKKGSKSYYREGSVSIRRYISIVLMVLSSGCASQEEETIGIGTGIDELKESCCPCGDVFYRNGIWLS